MDNRRVKFCLKILSRFGKIIRKPQGVKFFGAPCSYAEKALGSTRCHLYPVYTLKQTWSKDKANVYKIHVHDMCSKLALCLLYRVNGVLVIHSHQSIVTRKSSVYHLRCNYRRYIAIIN